MRKYFVPVNTKYNTKSLAKIELSDDPDKNYNNFYCTAAIRFPHISKRRMGQPMEIKCILTLF